MDQSRDWSSAALRGSRQGAPSCLFFKRVVGCVLYNGRALYACVMAFERISSGVGRGGVPRFIGRGSAGAIAFFDSLLLVPLSLQVCAAPRRRPPFNNTSSKVPLAYRQGDRILKARAGRRAKDVDIVIGLCPTRWRRVGPVSAPPRCSMPVQPCRSARRCLPRAALSLSLARVSSFLFCFFCFSASSSFSFDGVSSVTLPAHLLPFACLLVLKRLCTPCVFFVFVSPTATSLLCRLSVSMTSLFPHSLSLPPPPAMQRRFVHRSGLQRP